MPVDPATVKNQVAPVNMKTEAATPANNNVGKDGNSTQPTTALNLHLVKATTRNQRS